MDKQTFKTTRMWSLECTFYTDENDGTPALAGQIYELLLDSPLAKFVWIRTRATVKLWNAVISGFSVFWKPKRSAFVP